METGSIEYTRRAAPRGAAVLDEWRSRLPAKDARHGSCCCTIAEAAGWLACAVLAHSRASSCRLTSRCMAVAAAAEVC